MNKPVKHIDVSSSIKEKIPNTYQKLPKYVFRLIERIILQDEMNSIIQSTSHLQGAEMINWILKYFGAKVKVQGRELIPQKGRNIFPANKDERTRALTLLVSRHSLMLLLESHVENRSDKIKNKNTIAPLIITSFQ